MSIATRMTDVDAKGNTGGTEREVTLVFKYRLVELLTSEEPMARATAELKAHFDRVKEEIIQS